MITSSSTGDRDQNPDNLNPGMRPGLASQPPQSFQDLVAALRRHSRLILSCALGALTVAAGLTAMRPQRFTADAVLALDARKVQVLPLDAVVSRLPNDSPVLRTELDIIASRQMADLVLQSLNYPETGAARRDTIDRLLSSLKVSNDGRSFTINVSFTDRSPETAATLANAFADTYLSQLTDVQTSATRTAGEWLGQKLESLRSRLEAAETAAQVFRRDAGLIESNGATLLEQRLGALTVELAAARSARVGAEARLATARDLARSDAGLDTLNEATASPTIQLLRKDLGEASRNLADLEDAGAMKSPQIPALKSQIGVIRKQIAIEYDRIVAALANEVEIARRKEREVAEAAALSEAAVNRAKAQSVQLNQLEREANANRTVYESFLNRYKQTLEQQGLSAPEARIISRAEPPREPNSSRLPTLILALLGGTGLGLGLAYLKTRFDHSIRSLAALERFGVPVLCTLPDLATRQGALSQPPQLMPVLAPGSTFATALRRLSLMLRLTQEQTGSRVVMITPAEPEAGATNVCVALARSLSRSGQRVVVCEGDIAHPQLAAAFGRNAQVGTRPAADAQAFPHGILQSDPHSSVHFIAGPASDSHSTGQLGSERFDRLVAALRDAYDVVLISAPAFADSPDVVLGAGCADDILMVVRWGHTDYATLGSTIQQLQLCDVTIDGLVVTDVEPSAHGRVNLTTSPHMPRTSEAPRAAHKPRSAPDLRPYPEAKMASPRIVSSLATERAE